MDPTRTSPRSLSKSQGQRVGHSGPWVQVDPLHKANWDSASTKIFLELVIEQIHEGNRPHCILTAAGYKALSEKFHVATGRLHDKKQLKNRYDALRKDWIAWMKLKDDHVTGLFTAPTHWWESMEAMNSRVAKFRMKPLNHIDLMKQVFSGASATGRHAWTLTEVDVGPVDSSDSNGMTPFPLTEPDADRMPQHTHATSLFPDEEGISGSTSKGKGKQKRRRSEEESIAASMNNLSEVMKAPTREFRIIHEGASQIPAMAIERLCNIPGITPGDPLYTFAVTLMDDAANLNILLTLPAKFVKNWLEMNMTQMNRK